MKLFPICILILALIDVPISSHLAMAENSAEPGRTLIVYLPLNRADYRGNVTTPYPIGVGPSVRYQQVFDAKLFPDLATNHWMLYRLWFDHARGSYIFGSNFTLRVSTTSISSTNLNKEFSTNVGKNELIVYRTDSVAISSPFAFDNGGLQFDTPFVYEPSQGNLLLDLSFEQRFYENPGDVDSRTNDYLSNLLHAEDNPNDGIGRVVEVGEAGAVLDQSVVADSVGLIVRFEFVAFALSSRITTDSLEILYNRYPSIFRLQYSDEIANAQSWKDVSGFETRFEDRLRVIKIPLSSLPKRRFFRLYFDSPQNGINP